MAVPNWLVPADISNALLFVALGSLAAMLAGAAKAGFGGGIALLATPTMIYACGRGNARLAVGIMLPLLMACDVVAVAVWWRKWHWRAVRPLLAGAVAGIALGWSALRAVHGLSMAGQKQIADACLMLGIGLISICFVVIQAVRWLRGRGVRFRPVLWQGTCVGAATGFTSTLSHGAGPIITMYLLSQQMAKTTFVASMVLYFWINNILKLVPYFAEDMVNLETLAASLLLLPGGIAGALLGLLVHRRLKQQQFSAVVHVLLLLAGAGLIYKAARELLS